MKTRKKRKTKKLIIYLLAATAFSALLGAFWLVREIQKLPIPDLATFEERKVIQSTKIYDRTGKNLLYDIHQDIKRTVISYDDMPRNIKNATVAIEDSDFYSHGGIKIMSLIRALLVNITSGQKKQGGSTITQQLVKNTFLTNEKTITRKLKEFILAIKIEKLYTKEEILTLYLNEIPYGGSNYGIEAASQSFFGKNAKDLTLAESAYLAAVPKAPTHYSPYGNYRDELEERKNFVLKRMSDLGFISEDEREAAGKEKVEFIKSSEKGIRAPHFVMFIKSYLEDKYGKDMVEEGGLKVITTIDLKLQEEAEKMVEDFAKENEKKFNAKNAGMIGIDPKTGQILVMVGSRNYFDKDYEGNFNVTLAKRQPGSSFKPFVYATAFKKGFTPDTVVFDLLTEFNSSCNPDGTPKLEFGTKSEECYMPTNYDEKYRGPISLRNALAQSINIPAVKVLYLSGIANSLETAKDLGINTLTEPSRYGLTLVLGGGEVTLLQMTSAYSIFANDGLRNPATSILKVEDDRGNVMEEFSPNRKQALDKQIVRQINDILSDENARAPAFGSHSYLYFDDRNVAVKTGTTNDYRDAWVIGYTPNFALGVWTGNNDNSSMEKKVAGFIAAPLWNAYFKKVFENLPKEDFTKPEREDNYDKLKLILKGYWQGGKTYPIDKISQKLATEFTPPELIENKVLTQVHSILYWVDKENPRGEIPSHPENNPQFLLWETPVRKWAAGQGIKEQTMDDIPKNYDDIHLPEYAPEIKIISPFPNENFNVSSNVTVKIEPISRYPLEQIDFYFNADYLGSLKISPFEFIFKIDRPGTLKIIAYDSVRNKKEYEIPLTVNIF